MPESKLVHGSAKAQEVIEVRGSDYNTVLPYSALGTGRQEHSRQGAAVEKTVASLAWKTLCVRTLPRAMMAAGLFRPLPGNQNPGSSIMIGPKKAGHYHSHLCDARSQPGRPAVLASVRIGEMSRRHRLDYNPNRNSD